LREELLEGIEVGKQSDLAQLVVISKQVINF